MIHRYMMTKRLLILSLISVLAMVFPLGCTVSMKNIIKAVSGEEALLPDASVVKTDLEGRSFVIGRIMMDIKKEEPQKYHVLPDNAYIQLLKERLGRAFLAAKLIEGSTPPYRVNIFIEQMRFPGKMLLFKNDIEFRTRIEIVRPDNTIVMRGSLKCRESNTTLVPIYAGGVISYIPFPSGKNLVPHGWAIPAMAVLVTKVCAGLKDGNTLENIKVYTAGDTAPIASIILRKREYGIHPLSYEETASITGLDLKEFEPPEPDRDVDSKSLENP